MIVLACNNCEGTKIKKYEGKMTEKGHDWFTCEDCGNNFTLKKASYREEFDIYG